MMYALIILSLVAALTWSAWRGMDAPSIDTSGVRAQILRTYERARDRLIGAVKEEAREQLHKAVDEKLD